MMAARRRGTWKAFHPSGRSCRTAAPWPRTGRWPRPTGRAPAGSAGGSARAPVRPGRTKTGPSRHRIATWSRLHSSDGGSQERPCAPDRDGPELLHAPPRSRDRVWRSLKGRSVTSIVGAGARRRRGGPGCLLPRATRNYDSAAGPPARGSARCRPDGPLPHRSRRGHLSWHSRRRPGTRRATTARRRGRPNAETTSISARSRPSSATTRPGAVAADRRATSRKARWSVPGERGAPPRPNAAW